MTRIMPELVLKSAVAILGCLVAADITGELMNAVLGGLMGDPSEGFNIVLAYTIWLVVGVFCGLFAYNYAGSWSSPKTSEGDWTTRSGASRIGTGVLVVGLLVVVSLAVLCQTFIWPGAGDRDYDVPFNMPRSIVFFVTVIGAMVFARFSLMSGSGTEPK
jgi:H+/Cl- antiporter ClcA